MQKERLSREEFLQMFTEDVIRLSKYIPWLEERSGADVSKNYQDGDKMKATLSFPVYDSILLAFLNEASTTVFMEQNYHYFYTKHHIKDYVDELNLIEKADIMHMDNLQCILSRYVFGGMVKAYLWKDGVENRIFVSVLKKARQIVEFWSEPLIITDEIPKEGYPEPFEYPEVDEADWTDEEFNAVLAGELDPNDIPRLRYEKEHGITSDAGVADVSGAEPTVLEVLVGEIELPEVDDDDWTDEEFAAVLAGEIDPADIPKLRYEKEHNVILKFVEAKSEAVSEGAVEAVSAEPPTVLEVAPGEIELPEVDDDDWTDEEFGAVLAGEIDPADIPKLRYEKEHNVILHFIEKEDSVEEAVVEEAVVEDAAESVVEESVEESDSEEVTGESEDESALEESVEEVVVEIVDESDEVIVEVEAELVAEENDEVATEDASGVESEENVAETEETEDAVTENETTEEVESETEETEETESEANIEDSIDDEIPDEESVETEVEEVSDEKNEAAEESNADELDSESESEGVELEEKPEETE